jgi:hypothetical protein
MKAEIRHSDRMRIRVAKSNTQPRPAIDKISGLGSELLPIAFYDVSIHSNPNPRVSDAEKVGKFTKMKKAAAAALQFIINEKHYFFFDEGFSPPGVKTYGRCWTT